MKKYQNIIWSLGAIIIVLAGLIWLFPNKQDARSASILSAATNGVLSAEETNFNFKTISMAAGNVSHNFKVKNTGSETLAINKVYTSCMCTQAVLKKDGVSPGPFGMPGHGFNPPADVVLKPGEEVDVEAIFDPAAHGPAGLGAVNRTITLENTGRGGKLELSFNANVTP